MPRYGKVQTNWTAGELDPALADTRIDLKAYVNGAEKMRNVVVIPQGGAVRRPGLEFIGQLPYTISEHDLSGATVTAPNGGTAANATDDDSSTVVLTTSNIGTTDPYVIVHVDLGAAAAIKFIDVDDLLTSGGSVDCDDEVRWQFSDDNSAWTSVSPTFDTITTSGRTRRVTPDSSHRYWRLARVGSTDLGTQKFSLSQIKFWTETATISSLRIITFPFSVTQRYVLAVTDGNIRVFRDDTYQIDVAIPHRAADLAEITWARNLDTLLIFHEDYPVRRILRQGANDEWQSDLWPLKNLPTNTFDNDTTGNNLTLSASTVGTSKTFTAASAIFDATMDDDPVYHIVGIDGGRAKVTGFTSSTVVTCEITEAFTSTSITGGEWFLQEPVWSAERGYPLCGVFFQGRLWLAGSKSLPNRFWASRSGDPTDFNTLKTSDSFAIEGEADSDQDGVPEFRAVYAGRHLQFFASTGEFYVPVSDESVVTPENVSLRRSTSRGSEKGRSVAEVSGATVFLQKGGKALREFLFVDTEQAYTAVNLSLLASHLITSPVDLALRKSTSTEEADYFYLVNSDGSLAVFCTLRDQEINGWTLCSTDGDFVAVGTLEEDSYFAVNRTINGTDVTYLEKFNVDMHVDAGVAGTGVAASASGLDHLDGELAAVRLDDLTQEDIEVTSGAVTFARSSAIDWEVGLHFPDVTAAFDESDPDYATGFETFLRTLSPEEALPEGTQIHRKKKISNINAVVATTLGLYVNGRFVPTRNFGSGLLDAAGKPASEILEVKSSLGWRKQARVAVGQKDAHPMRLYGLAYEVSV